MFAADDGEKEKIIAAQSDSDAFVHLYDETYERVFLYILKRCGDYHLAQDIVSETYLKALKQLHTYQYRGTPFVAWLYRIACNELNMYFRKQAKYRCEELEQHHELIDFSSDVAAKYEAVEHQQVYVAMRAAIAQLSEVDQTIITLKFFEEKTIPEIAAIVEMREGTVKSRLSRALRRVRMHLQRSGDNRIIQVFHGNI